jgi:hypothetical protein
MDSKQTAANQKWAKVIALRSTMMAFRMSRGETIANNVRANLAVAEYENRLMDASAIY